MSPLLPPQVAELVVRRRSQPRTILSFLFGIATVIFTGIVVLAIALIDTESAWLIAPLIAVGLVIAVGVMVAVFVRAGTDPAGLMLTNVSGPEYESIQRTLTLGNSSGGERVAVMEYAGDALIPGTATEVQASSEEAQTAAEPEDGQ